MKYLFVLAVFVLFCSVVYPQDLPQHLTDEEKEMMKTYVFPKSSEAFVTPPLKPVRTMAEWERLEGIMITWTSYQTILKDIVDYAQDEGMVYIVCSDSNTVKNYLTSYSVPLVNLKFLIAPFNSIWCRDYGPWSVYSDIADEQYIIDWVYNRPRPNDDVIPAVIAGYKNYPLYQTTTSPYNLINTGGNFMADGQGTAFASKLVISENPSQTSASIDTIMKKFMGIKRYVKMDVLPYDGIHHIDMHMKLLDEETILVGQYPAGVSDGPQIEANLQYVLNNFLNCYGRPYKVVRIPMPPDQNGKYPSQGGIYRTYTNSVFVNKTVIVPTYELQYDTTALRIYREALPGYRIVGINSNQIIPSSGAIHCITKEIGSAEPVVINYPKILTTAVFETGYPVKAFIKTRTGISSAILFWSTDTSAGFNQAGMQMFAPDSFSAEIPVQPFGTRVWYYVSAQSVSGVTETKPMTAPSGAYSFTSDNIVPVELISFNAILTDGGVTISWETATETNNKGFRLERGINQSAPAEIAFIPGNGTTASQSSYTFADRVKLNGGDVAVYRLVQVDFDGTETFGKETEVRNDDVPLRFSLMQNYPNPFNPITVINYELPFSGNVSLRIYDVTGREVATLVNETQQAGRYSVDFNGRDLATGVYYCKISAGSFVSVKKMILVK